MSLARGPEPGGDCNESAASDGIPLSNSIVVASAQLPGSVLDPHKSGPAETQPSLSLVPLKKPVPPEINELIQGDNGDDTDTVMIGVEIFEESDLDAENKAQLYSDGDVAPYSSDPLVIEQADIGSKSAVKSTDVDLKKPHHNGIQTQTPAARLSLGDRIKCIRMCSRYASYVDAQKAWKGHYGTEPPCRKTMSHLDKKFEKTGSVADLNRSGRPKTTRTEAVIAKVEAAIRKDPNKSIRVLSRELGITQASVHRIKKEFEDKRNTLKMENKKLKEKLNDALKRIVILERRLSQNLETNTMSFVSSANSQPNRVELVLASPSSLEPASYITTTNQIDSGPGMPAFIALNPVNNHIPSVLRLQQQSQETIHIITLPPSTTTQHQLLSLDESTPIQLSIPSDGVGQIQVMEQ